jgi:hypothetical protein
MNKFLYAIALTSCSVSIGLATSARADNSAIIKSAESAAPANVAASATIVEMSAGKMRTVREGKNGFTCMPDNSKSPGNDPMCLDKNAMAWAMARASQKDPPQGKVGFMYMLQGGSDASNTDPFAKKPANGANWLTTGPHVMVVGATDLAGYPATASPDTTLPYVMWPGTPFAHLMIPMH